jgi:hypothetical protein
MAPHCIQFVFFQYKHKFMLAHPIRPQFFDLTVSLSLKQFYSIDRKKVCRQDSGTPTSQVDEGKAIGLLPSASRIGSGT